MAVISIVLLFVAAVSTLTNLYALFGRTWNFEPAAASDIVSLNRKFVLSFDTEIWKSAAALLSTKIFTTVLPNVVVSSVADKAAAVLVCVSF